MSHPALRSSPLALSILLSLSASTALAQPSEAPTPPSANAVTTPTPGDASTAPESPSAPVAQSTPPPAASSVADAASAPAGVEETATPAATPTSEEPEASPPSSETKTPETNSPEAPAHDHLAIGGGAIVYLYQPTREGRGNVGVFFANLLLDGKWGDFAFHVEPRFRDTKLRPFFDGPAWLQEAYASFTFAPATLKLGKVYKRSGGLFWDNSFFGNVQVYDGLKLDPNYGASLEGSVGDRLGLDFAVQYFVVDGSTNVSLQGRDTISVAGARRRHTKAAKVEPWLEIADSGELRLGGSIEHFVADIPDAHDQVLRVGGDLAFRYDFGGAGSFGVWGEFVHQSGRHVTDHPLVGGASDDTDYVLAGAQYTFWKFTARYNLSNANYSSVDVKETLQVPGLGVAVHEHLTLLGELAHWRHTRPLEPSNTMTV